MIKYDYFYPKGKNKPLELTIYLPDTNGTFDVLYLLDGQNAFRDHKTLYNNSLRLEGKLNYVNNKNRLMAVAIASDEHRTNTYSPFKIKNTTTTEWLNNDIKVCKDFMDIVINELIPYIDNKYNTNRGYMHRFIYGSSLASITALYLSLGYKDSFSYTAAFSTASFIYDKKEFNSFITANISNKNNILLYVGAKEESDGEYDSSIYLDYTNELYKLIVDKCNSRLIINKNGTHSEVSWRDYILDFISYIYKK